MHKSNLPYRYRFITMHLLTSTKKFVKKIKKQLRGKNCHSTWHIGLKLCETADKRDGWYILEGRIEL